MTRVYEGPTVLEVLAPFATAQAIAAVDAAEKAEKTARDRFANLSTRLDQRIGVIKSYHSDSSDEGRVLELVGGLLKELEPADLEQLPKMEGALRELRGFVEQRSKSAFHASSLGRLLAAAKSGDASRLATPVQDLLAGLTFAITSGKNPAIAALGLEAPLKQCAAFVCEGFASDPFTFESSFNPVASIVHQLAEVLKLAALVPPEGRVAAIATSVLMALDERKSIASLKNHSQADTVIPIALDAAKLCTDAALRERVERALAG